VGATPRHAQAARSLARRDERLREAIRAVGPCTLEVEPEQPFTALIGAIAHQQVHGAAARAILGRLKALYGPAPRLPTPAELLATPDEALRGAGFSAAKLRALKDVAAKTLDGTVPDLATIAALSDEQVIERLTTVRGVGRWTAEMLLMFTLGRADVLPVADFGIRLGFRLLHGKRAMPKPSWLADYGARWAPHRTIASWYLWRYVDHLRATAPAKKRRKPGKAAGAGAKARQIARAGRKPGRRPPNARSKGRGASARAR
jgi:DNA-3-methyladenine glycosylase II